MHEGFWTQFMYKFCYFLLVKFWFIVTFFLFGRLWWYLWTKRPKHNTFELLKCFLEKSVKSGTYRNFCKICPKLKKFQFFVKFEYIVAFLLFFYSFDKKWISKPIFYFHPFFRRKNTHLKPKKYHFLEFWINDPNSTKFWNFCYQNF